MAHMRIHGRGGDFSDPAGCVMAALHAGKFCQKEDGQFEPVFGITIGRRARGRIKFTPRLCLLAGSEPQILYYAGRFSPTRFITVYPFTYPPAPVAKLYQAEAIRDLEAHPPSLIVPRAINHQLAGPG